MNWDTTSLKRSSMQAKTISRERRLPVHASNVRGTHEGYVIAGPKECVKRTLEHNKDTVSSF